LGIWGLINTDKLVGDSLINGGIAVEKLKEI
jgi:hypothetical protein